MYSVLAALPTNSVWDLLYNVWSQRALFSSDDKPLQAAQECQCCASLVAYIYGCRAELHDILTRLTSACNYLRSPAARQAQDGGKGL